MTTALSQVGYSSSCMWKKILFRLQKIETDNDLVLFNNIKIQKLDMVIIMMILFLGLVAQVASEY